MLHKFIQPSPFDLVATLANDDDSQAYDEAMQEKIHGYARGDRVDWRQARGSFTDW